MLSNHLDATDLHVVYLGVLLSGIGVLLARSLVARSAELRLPAAAGVLVLVALFLAPLILTKAWGRRERPDELRDADVRLDSPGWVGRYGRTAVALKGKELLLVTTVRKAQDALTMLDFAQALKDLGCQEALNLDGGPSTTLWAEGATQNLPRGRRADAVASGLFVLPPGEGVSLR
tara:strand:- start:393 stop:920 length:528 start_codon:yes stop_codon:yes gene_type:complete